MGNLVSNLPYKIIAVVQSNIRYLLDNPKQLAWCLFCYDRMHLAVRYSGTDTDNPKYIFLDNPETDWPGLSEKELNTLYEAWGVSVSNDIPNDQCFGVIPKKNMTLDEWVELKLNPGYEYNSLYRTRHDVVNNLFCVIGTGMNWNEDGFISDGRDGVDEAIFYGYSQAEKEVEPKIRNKIKKICNDRRVRYWFEILYNTAVEFNQLTGEQKSKLRHNIFYVDRTSMKDDHTFMLRHIRNAKNNVFEKPKNPFMETLERIAKASGKTVEEIEASLDKNDQAEECEQIKATKEGRFFYPISKNYSNIGRMPDNAHISYVKEAVRIAKIIVSGQAVTYGEKSGEVRPAHKEMVEVAQSILDKWESKVYATA